MATSEILMAICPGWGHGEGDRPFGAPIGSARTHGRSWNGARGFGPRLGRQSPAACPPARRNRQSSAHPTAAAHSYRANQRTATRAEGQQLFILEEPPRGGMSLPESPTGDQPERTISIVIGSWSSFPQLHGYNEEIKRLKNARSDGTARSGCHRTKDCRL
jgi:hypothetical protein